MSFSKAKLKRFNDVDVGCASPAAATNISAASKSETMSTTTSGTSGTSGTPTHASSSSNANNNSNSNSNSTTATSSASCTSAHPERREQIEKFFKDAVRFASSSKEAKDFAIPKEGGVTVKEDKKSKGLRLFRTPSLPHRLRFRQHSEASNSNNNNISGTASSTPLHSTVNTPVKTLPKSAGGRLKGKEALQQEIRNKNELIAGYLSQLDVLKRHVEQLKQTEQQLRDENASRMQRSEALIHALTNENVAHKELNDQLSSENTALAERTSELEAQLHVLKEVHSDEVKALCCAAAELEAGQAQLKQRYQQQTFDHEQLQARMTQLQEEICVAREKLAADEQKAQKNFELIQNLKNTNDALITDVQQLKHQIEQDTFSYAQEAKSTQNELECMKKERSSLKQDLASKCELIRALQEELLDKDCELDAHSDTIRQLCREKAQYVERERLMEAAEEKIRCAETQAEQKMQKLESDLESAVEREKAYWRAELDKRQKMAENELIKIELEKQDVMVLLETTNDMLRERDEKLQSYEDQLRNGIDYYVQLTGTLQRQVVDLKQEMAKIITEKYNYQLTLSNTRSTVNILMERLKKSDADVEQYKAEIESVQLAKGALEQSYLSLQRELEALRGKLDEAEDALDELRNSSETLQQEVNVKERMFNDLLTSEEETLANFNKIASSFQQRIDTDTARYVELYNELKQKDEKREFYMQDMKKALDEFATVLQFAQLELDSKDKSLLKVREECEQLKLENISLKSKVEENNSIAKKENITDLEKIEDLLIDSELRAECDKITSWLLSSSTEKCVRNESATEMSELLKPSTPQTAGNKSRTCTTPVRSTNKNIVTTAHSPRTPRTPHTPHTPKTPRTPHTPRTTPKKATVLFPGKENMPSPQKQVLKTRNM